MGVFESTLGCDVDLYRGLIRSVLEYGCIAFDRMAATHLLKLERIQYRCLRIELGLMQSTHIQTLDVIGGVQSMRLRFSMLNNKYLILAAFSTGGHGHLLRRLLTVLSRLNSTKMVREFDMGLGLRYGSSPLSLRLPTRGVTTRAQCQRYGGAGKLTSVGSDFYQMVMPHFINILH
jgi:hypothetical protein